MRVGFSFGLTVFIKIFAGINNKEYGIGWGIIMNFFDIENISERNMELISPISREKIILIGEVLKLKAESRVIDFGCGFGEMLALWGEKFGISGVGIEIREYACDQARKKMTERGLADRYTSFVLNWKNKGESPKKINNRLRSNITKPMKRLSTTYYYPSLNTRLNGGLKGTVPELLFEKKELIPEIQRLLISVSV